MIWKKTTPVEIFIEEDAVIIHDRMLLRQYGQPFYINKKTVRKTCVKKIAG